MIKVGHKIKIREIIGRNNQIISGNICIITKHFIVVQTRLFKECFTFNDLRIGRYEFLRLKKGETV